MLFVLFLGLTKIFSACTKSGEEQMKEVSVKSNKKFVHPYISDTVKVVHKFGENNCTSCHQGIEHIREENTGMMQQILAHAELAGHQGNDCIVCHGGNPNTTNAEEAHSGTIAYFKENKGPKEYYPDPGSPWINEHTCGMCHSEQVKTQFTSLMFTEAGKIQGSLWGFGGMNGYKHDVGNYDTQEVDPHEVLGTETYKKYVAELKKLEPNVFPESMTELPAAPIADEVQENPQLAVYTYLRQECQRCHTGSKGRSKRGDYRGMGCSSCHIPYSNEGFYEGNDSTHHNSEKRGKPLVHTMQGTRKSKVKVNGKSYSGVPTETCTTCHDRGKRIGTSYQGLMETAYSSPFMGDGENQEKLHTKHYLHLHADVHLEKGMLCQDCHTSSDVHSDGLLAGTTLAPVEIECQDCHGTAEQYPWDLPIGYSDEVGGLGNTGNRRGVLGEIAAYLKQGTEYHPRDGYLVTARGNPYTNVVKDGNKVIVHTAGGKDLVLKPLKYLADNKELSLEGEVAMKTVGKHMETMECYSCHATWAPQCYGCHIKIDYSEGKQNPDWLAMGKHHDASGLSAEARGLIEDFMIDGEVQEQRSYLRWENPPLVVNGENRVSPAIPGCQTTVTVIGKDGDPLLLNHIFKIPGVEGADSSGQLGIDISPVQPHTISKRSRTCEGCHNNPQSMGYGIEAGSIYSDPSKGYTVDLTSADGEVLPIKTKEQIGAIENLTMDWSRFIDEEGNQLQTVGHHFSGSRPLNNEERGKLDRTGVCMACHQSLPAGDLAIDLLHHIKEVRGDSYDTKGHNNLVNKVLKTSAWGQLIIGLIIGVLVMLIGFFIVKKIRSKRKG